MKLKKSLTQSHICLLGSVDGLFVGLVAEKARLGYVNHQMTEAMRDYAQSDWSADFFQQSWELFVPLMCIVTFAGVSHLIHRYFINRPQSLLWFWSIIGGVGLWAGYFMATSKPNLFSLAAIAAFAGISYLAHRFWRQHPQSVLGFWMVTGVSAVIVVAASLQLIGLLWMQQPELKNSFTWLLCLAAVMVINLIYGVVVELFLLRYKRREFMQTSA